jgi:integrase
MQPEGHQAAAVPTFDEFTEDFRQYLVESGCPRRTASSRMRVYDEVLHKYAGDVTLDRFTPARAAALKAAVRIRTPRGVDAVYSVLAHVFTAAVARQVIVRPPCDVEQFKCRSDIEAPLTARELDALLDAAAKVDPRALAIVLLGVDAGLQGAEMDAVRPADIDLTEKLLFVRNVRMDRSAGSGRSATPFGEEIALVSGRTRTVPLTSRLLAALSGLEGSATVLTDDRGRRTTHNSRRPWLAESRTKAGIERGVSLDHLRLSFETRLALAGTPAPVLRSLKGCSGRFWPFVAEVTLEQKRAAIAALERGDDAARTQFAGSTDPGLRSDERCRTQP